MAEEATETYVTKSGRISKQRFKHYNFPLRLKVSKTNMPILRDDEVEANRRRERELEQQNLERQRRELEQLRAEIEAQRAALERTQQQQQQQPAVHDNPQVERNQSQNNRLEEIAAIVGNVQNFHAEIKMPKFDNEIDRNPAEFLDEIDKFFKIKSVKNEKKMNVIEHALQGKAALWFELRVEFRDYDQFKEDFLNEFYSIPIRVLFKNRWLERRCNANDESLQTYYYRQLRDARYFSPRLTAYEINYNIIQQYPVWIREALATVDFNNETLIGQTLGSLDGIRRERAKNRDNRPWNQNDPARPPVRVRQMDIDQPQPNHGYTYESRQYSGRRPYYHRPRGYYRYAQYDRSSIPTQYSQQSVQLPDTRFPPPINSQPQANEIVSVNNQSGQNTDHLNLHATR